MSSTTTTTTPAEAAKPPARSGRRELGTSFENDAQATGAAKMLLDIEGDSDSSSKAGRYEDHYDLSIVKPSPNNPRRVSLDRAGVTDAQIRSLIQQSGESYERWTTRLDTFIDMLHTENKVPSVIATWEELFELAVSIFRNGLLQPIVIRPDNMIIAGERRWVACMLSGKRFAPVLIKHTTDQQAAKLRLIENIHREDLSLEEKVLSCREIMLIETGYDLGPDNPGISMEAIKLSIGCRHTQSSYYAAMCKLPADDPVLTRIISGEFTSLKAAYQEASRRNRQLMDPAGSGSENEGGGNDPQNHGSGTQSLKPQSPPKQAVPQAKIRMPGTAGGQKLFAALKGIDGLSKESIALLDKSMNSWTGAPEKVRKKLLIDTLDALLASIDGEDKE